MYKEYKLMSQQTKHVEEGWEEVHS